MSTSSGSPLRPLRRSRFHATVLPAARCGFRHRWACRSDRAAGGENRALKSGLSVRISSFADSLFGLSEEVGIHACIRTAACGARPATAGFCGPPPGEAAARAAPGAAEKQQRAALKILLYSGKCRLAGRGSAAAGACDAAKQFSGCAERLVLPGLSLRGTLADLCRLRLRPVRLGKPLCRRRTVRFGFLIFNS